VRIAVIGSGVAGLVSAHLLDPHHEVTVYEAEDRIGGHVHTVDVETEQGRLAIDTGFIVHNQKTYPKFLALLARLGVETQASDMSFGVSCERTGIEWGSRGLGSIFAQRRNLVRPAFLRMARDVVRFNRECRALLEGEEKVSLRDYVAGSGYSRELVDLYLVPMGAAECPAATFARFFHNHGLLTTSPDVLWRVVQGGSRTYVDALVAGLRGEVRTATPVHAVVRDGRTPKVVTAGESRSFDRVVLAVHADQALALLRDPTVAERQVLSAIRFQPNDAVLHTDARVMPDRTRAWASWNYRIPRDPSDRVLVTYDMSRLQSLDHPERWLVTLNPGDRIDPERVHGRFAYDHPVFDGSAIAAQEAHAQVDGNGGVHFCGAYWGHGFHEDGVQSAVRVVDAIGGDTL
jgi:predicted NAD/FAD-binding protein